MLDRGDIIGALRGFVDLDQLHGFVDESVFRYWVLHAALEVRTRMEETEDEETAARLAALWASATFSDRETFNKTVDAECVFTRDIDALRYLEVSPRLHEGLSVAEDRREEKCSYLCMAASVARVEEVFDILEEKHGIDARTEDPPKNPLRKCAKCKKYGAADTCAGCTGG
jgi:hypothetical protein